jgi:hypothetical protein
MLQECTHVLKHYSQGCSTIRLEDMAVHPLNRNGTGVGGRHSQNTVRRICDKEGFAEWRYKRAICLAINPADPFENTRFTNNYVVKQKTLLASVADVPLPGSIAKCHLWHGLLTLKCGQYKYYDTNLPMYTNRDDAVLAMVLRNGLLYERLDHEAVVKHKDAVLNLMNGDNLDAAYAVAQTEVALIAAYFHSCRIITPKPGQVFWDAVCQEVDPTLGNKFSDNLKMAAYSFASTVGPEQLHMLVDIYQYFVDPKVFEIGVNNLQAVADMPAAAGWCKIAAIIINIVTKKQKQTGDKMRGIALPDAVLHKIAKVAVLGKRFWDKIEACLGGVLQHYTLLTVQGGSSDSLMHLGRIRLLTIYTLVRLCLSCLIKKTHCAQA